MKLKHVDGILEPSLRENSQHSFHLECLHFKISDFLYFTVEFQMKFLSFCTEFSLKQMQFH